MFSVITNICNKKTKGPTLMELFTATGKLKKFFSLSLSFSLFDSYRCSMSAPRVTRHTSIRYSSSCHTRVNIGASIFFTAAMIRAFRSARSRKAGPLRTLHEMHVAQYSCDIPTHKTTSPPPERPFSHYTHSHRLAAEMWTTKKNNLLGKFFWVFPSICTGFVNTCPTVFLY